MYGLRKIKDGPFAGSYMETNKWNTRWKVIYTRVDSPKRQWIAMVTDLHHDTSETAAAPTLKDTMQAADELKDWIQSKND